MTKEQLADLQKLSNNLGKLADYLDKLRQSQLNKVSPIAYHGRFTDYDYHVQYVANQLEHAFKEIERASNSLFRFVEIELPSSEDI